MFRPTCTLAIDGWLFPSLNSVHASSHRRHPTHLVGSAKIMPFALVLITRPDVEALYPAAFTTLPNADTIASDTPAEAPIFRNPRRLVTLVSPSLSIPSFSSRSFNIPLPPYDPVGRCSRRHTSDTWI